MTYTHDKPEGQPGYVSRLRERYPDMPEDPTEIAAWMRTLPRADVEAIAAETPTPEDFVPVGPETALALRQQPSQFHISLICGDVSNERALPHLKRCAEQASMEAAAMVDRELMEAIYVMLRVRG